jgi:DNA-binding MarR family transcriptional regulator
MAEPRWLSETEQLQWRALLSTVRLFNRTLEHQMLRDAGMPHAYFGILVTLAEAPDRRLRMGELAAELDFSPSRLSHAVTRMEAAGWVTRRPRPSSARERDAQLTDEGFAVLAQAAPGHVELVRSLLFDRFRPEELEQLQQLCERLAPALVDTTDFGAEAACVVEDECAAEAECAEAECAEAQAFMESASS